MRTIAAILLLGGSWGKVLPKLPKAKDVCDADGCGGGRTMMINGDLVTSEAPFVVALMQCTTTGGTQYCAKFCTGSLIAPDVVLTAGHCVRDANSPYGVNNPPVALSSIFVMAGSVDVYSKPGEIRQASSLANHGYGLNRRYSFDKDAALVFLASCFEIVPGVIETIPIATLQTEPVWDDATSDCSSQLVKTYGFGIMTNLPSQVAKDDGKLKSISTRIHKTSTCVNAYVAATFANSGTDLAVLSLPQYSLVKDYYYSLFVAEYHLCGGGDSPDGSAACFGDSGGPVVSTIGGVSSVVGVTSFGASGFCGLGPDFSSRMATQADWVASQLAVRVSACAANVAASFTAWPPNTLSSFSKSFSSTRCGSAAKPWQCNYGTCIAEENVCDGSANCGAIDVSDEDASFCSASSRRLLEETSSQLDGLIAEYLVKNRKFVKAHETVVVGKVDIDVSRTPEMSDSLLGALGRTETSTTSLPVVDTTEATCAAVNSNLTTLINAEKNAASIASDTSSFQSACDLIRACKSAQPTYTSKSDLDVFCTGMTTFTQKAVIANTLALNFNTTYNLGCSVSPEGVPMATIAPTNEPSKSAQGIGFILSLAIVLLTY